MRVIKGNKSLELARDQLLIILKAYREVIIDIGTGDGRFVYKHSIKYPEKFYIGIDPSQKQLEIYSKKANRDKLQNCLFVQGSMEIFPEELYGIADKVTIILPWGSLLQNVVMPKEGFTQKLAAILKAKGELEMVFGYAHITEPSEVVRLGLENLDFNYVKTFIIPEFLSFGFTEATIKILQKEDLKNFESTWSKKLTFGQERPLFHVRLVKHPQKFLE